MSRIFPLMAILLLANSPPVLGDPPSNYQCVDWNTWIRPGFSPESCLRATYRLMQSAEALRDRRFEFLHNRSTASGRFATQITPYKINGGNGCTLVIMPFRDAGYVPGGPDPWATLPGVDDDTLVNLAHRANELYRLCVTQGKAGWIKAGAHDHLGVFFWATGSIKDRYVGRAGLDAIRIAANRKNANSLAVDAA
ncbi:MAG: hypothetical protein L6R35_003429 [Caloplaca aegaea]|nr:MAG: hypothetical protein L6R35_003429 [Caloplaca aegaea]